MSIMKKHHRKKVLAVPFKEEWEQILAEKWILWSRLGEQQRDRLRNIIRIMVDEKYWEGCGGLEIDDCKRVIIAAMAGTLLLDRDLGYFPNVHTILVYPEAYVQSQEMVGRDGLVHSGSANLGEAWYNGPVVLSWKDAEQSALHPGRATNVVQHEFAHALDMLTGMTNGTPPMRSRDVYASWHALMTREYGAIRSVYEQGGRDVIRPYGVSNVAEFFAVTTETFFDAPLRLHEHRPELFDAFMIFYGVDPRPWFEGNFDG